MNRNTLRALLADARYQVFDNSVFRILLGVSALFIALSFLIEFGDASISFFFGTWTLGYEKVAFMIDGSADERGRTIEVVQQLVVEFFAGQIGILLAIAATAFFTPRMLERGSADNVFSKPVGRFTLLLSRYFSGLLFVALLAGVTVFGMQAGLSIISGYNDPGFLWSAVTLVYVYALLQSFSIAVAVFTRNSVACILLTMLLFMFTGCVNSAWIGMEWVAEQKMDQLVDSAVTYEGPGDTEETPAEPEGAGSTEAFPTNEGAEETEGPDGMEGDDAVEVEVDREGGDRVFYVFKDIAHTLRSFLPRTGDAAILSRQLRRQVEGLALDVTIHEEVDGAREPVFFLESESTRFDFRGGGLSELDGEGLVWDVEGGGTIRVTREPRGTELTRTGREYPRRERSVIGEHRERMEQELGEDAILTETRADEGRRLDWRVPDDSELPLRSLIAVTRGDDLFRVRAELPTEALPAGQTEVESDAEDEDANESDRAAPEANDEEDHDHPEDPVLSFSRAASFGQDPNLRNPEAWYEAKFGWTSPWDFNAFVSIGTSLAFALVMLLLARWRLSRMDF